MVAEPVYLTTDAERARMQRDPWFVPIPDAVPLDEYRAWPAGRIGSIRGAPVYWRPADAG